MLSAAVAANDYGSKEYLKNRTWPGSNIYDTPHNHCGVAARGGGNTTTTKVGNWYCHTPCFAAAGAARCCDCKTKYKILITEGSCSRHHNLPGRSLLYVAEGDCARNY